MPPVDLEIWTFDCESCVSISMVPSDFFTFFIDISDGYVDSSLWDFNVDYYIFAITWIESLYLIRLNFLETGNQCLHDVLVDGVLEHVMLHLWFVWLL